MSHSVAYVPPAYASPPPVQPPSTHARGRRNTALVVFGAAVAVLAGLLFVRGGPEESGGVAAGPSRGRTAFHQALTGVAAARLLRYEDSAADGTRRDVTVTPSGTLFGSVSGGGRDLDVLHIDSTTYTRPGQGAASANQDEGPPGLRREAAGRWTRAEPGDSPLEPVRGRFPAPTELAEQLRDALDELRTVPDTQDRDLPAEQVRGVPVLRADTAAGSLLVTRERPHRLLRLEPPASSGRAAGPLRYGSRGTDVFPLDGERAAARYDTLAAEVARLGDAVDPAVEFPLDDGGLGVLCGDDGCTVRQSFTGRLTGTARSRVGDGRVSALLRAAISIEGVGSGGYTGGCTGPREDFPVTGTTVVGTLSCSDPEAGAAFSAAVAACRSRSAPKGPASGRRSGTCRPSVHAVPYVDALALSDGEVAQLVEQVKCERRPEGCAPRKRAGQVD
ncbi:hypothetical protein QIS99_04770 [Streptomyces sp. B-S-A8]|uniref:LigA protein n=1 Tax=Streptomyces solicavernae TaxID=3043614 RepID=A0ABT6RMJ3_9ACTN|nr:hypothetical protein [Streptomyces sp. B-S-A8]MDI3385530.1 hypothetical protein [Streptomyces sp. B-S-A8]